MFGQQVLKDIFYVFYGGVAALNLAACLYLLLRRSNAIAPDITSPPRLRRWAAAFFGASALSHVWNMPVYMLTSEADVMQGYLVAGLLDCMTIGPLALMILIVMLQDRRRPLWPVGVVVAPFVKDGKYVYVGDKAGAEAFVQEGKTEVVDYTGKGLVMPGCGNGHAHYSLGYAIQAVGTVMSMEDDVNTFLTEIVPGAVRKARETGATAIFGQGWNARRYSPVRQ